MMMNKKKPFSLHLDVDSFMPATAEEKEVISRMRPSSTFFRDGVKRLLKNKVATISLILIVLITLSSIIIPMFWPYSYDQMLGQTKGRPMDNSYNNLAPFQYGKTELKKIDKGESVFPHIFGTDAHGRDYFIRVVYGTRISLAVGFFASIIVLVIGMMIGAVAGYFGGRVDLFIMRIVDIIYSLPDMLVIILLSVVLGQVLHVEGTILEKIGSNIISMFIVFGLLYWVGMARLIRGQILSLREQEYVLSAQATGAKALYSLDLTPYGYDVKVENGTWAETYDVLISAIKSCTDSANRYAMMHIAEDMLMNTGCIVPLCYYTDIFMIDDSVQGFFSNPLGYKYFMHCTIAK